MVYCIDPSAAEPIMLLNQHIGYDEEDGQGIIGATFLQELLQLDTLGKKRIQVWINSPGGVVTDGYDIYSGILKTKTPVDTFCIGAAASIAGVIFQAGRKRIMTDYSWLMYHNPFGGGDGVNDTKMLNVMRQSLITMICQRSGMSEDDASNMMKRTSFIDASEALKTGLCDQIDPSFAENTKYLKKISDVVQLYRESNKVLNSVLNNSNSKQMEGVNLTKVTMRLKLNDSAPADDIVKAIDAIENRASVAEAKVKEVQDKAKSEAEASGMEMDALKEKLAKAEAAFEKAKKDYEDGKAKLDAMTADKKAAEDAAKEAKAKNMVDEIAKSGRIKNEETIKLKWVKLAMEDFDGTKEMLESISLNKSAVTITDQVANKLDKGVLPTTAVGLTVKNRLRREGKLA